MDSVSAVTQSYNMFINAIMNASGNENCIDKVVRLGFFTGSENNVNALKACAHGVLGILTADDDRADNYYLSKFDRDYIAESGKIYDEKNDIFMVRTQTRLENITSETKLSKELEKFEEMEGAGINMLEIFTHESEYDKVRGILIKYIEWAVNRGYSFEYTQNILSGLKAEAVTNPKPTPTPVIKPVLPDREADFLWDFSEYTSSINGSGIKEAIEYDGLTIGLNAARDNITDKGVYWHGQSSRYLTYTPEYDGILAAKVKNTEQAGSMKIKTDKEDELAVSDDAGDLIYADCKAGTKYYLIPTADYQRMYSVEYYVTSDVKPTPTSVPDIGDRVYALVTDAQQQSAQVIDTSKIYTNTYVKKLRVTIADKHKNQISQYETEVSDTVTVNTIGADKIEIAPVYTYAGFGSLSSKTPLDGYFEDGMYDFTFVKGNTNRSGDIYVNDKMAANNVYYRGYYNDFSGAIPYTAHDLVIEGGEIALQITDSAAYSMERCEIVKSPSIVRRKTKMWVLGDSLVQTYYGDAEPKTSGQRGWGQFLPCFLTDDIEVVNLSNAGHYAERLYSTAFPGVTANGQPGDYVVIEGGYNDVKHNTADEFYLYTVKMINMSKEKGLIPIVVSSNTCLYSDEQYDDFSPDLRYSAKAKQAAEESGAYYIDLAGLSYKFYSETYGTDEAAKTAIMNTYLFADLPDDHGCHHNYIGAMKWAQTVVQSMYDQNIISAVNQDYQYQYTDYNGNKLTLKIIDALSISAEKDANNIVLEIKNSTDRTVKLYIASYGPEGKLIEVRQCNTAEGKHTYAVDPNTHAVKVLLWDGEMNPRQAPLYINWE